MSKPTNPEFQRPTGGENGQPSRPPQYQVVQPGQHPQVVIQQGQQQPQFMVHAGQQPYMIQQGGQQQYIVQQGGQQPYMIQHDGQQQYIVQQGGQQMVVQPGQIPMQPMPSGQAPMQPRQLAWMARPAAMVPNCPPGLEYLATLDQLLVKQQIEIMEVFTNFEMKNRYIVRNAMGQQVYFAHEETDCCERQCCGAQRPFTLHIEDNMGQRVIQVERPFKCMCFGQCCSCSECCQDEVQVQAPPGEVVGYVKQLYEGCQMEYAITNASREIILRIKGPSYFHCYCPGDDVPFSLTSADGETEVGRISKQWSNLMREFFTDADNFGIQFPMDLDVSLKAVVLGAVFLIDFMYFENNRRRYR